ncbi:MAG: hypothetical protein EH225_01660 [Calditrichaeota bacterium]|nr:peptidyl-prolyl cis-trans isomerase [Calditrichota bacterium]RQW07530.1 MAG: hypothetical protein EH225_01660 [Calditrichota bacterium]
MKKFRIKNSLAIILFHLLLLLSCRKESQTDREIIATAGERNLDWQQIQRSFELNPKWGKGITYGEAYINQINYLIDQKLFAQAALSQNLHQDSLVSAYLNFITEKELIKELYRQVVASEINISEDEFQKAYEFSKKKVYFNYILTTKSGNAQHYLDKLKNTEFEEIMLVDPAKDRKGISLDATFGDLEPAIEQEIFEMEEEEIRGPIKVSEGYMIVQVTGGTIDKFTSEYDYAHTKNKLQKILFERKAAPLANAYIKEVMLDKDLELNPPVFYEISRQFSQIVQNKTSDNPLPVYLSDEEIKLSRNHLEDILDEVLITYRDGQMTVGEFLGILGNMPAGYRPQVKMVSQLKNAIGVVVRNKYLAEEARKKDLHKHPTVRREIEIQKDEILARQWLLNKRSGLVITEEDLIDFQESPEYRRVLQKFLQNAAQDQISDFYSDMKFAQLKLKLTDSLRYAYTVKIDSVLLFQKVKNSRDIITHDPVKFVVRDMYY